MTLTEIRETLAKQHLELRELAKAAGDICASLRAAGSAPDVRLREAVLSLASAIQRHNADEERLLGQVISTLDAWGPARKTLMEEHHEAEHHASLQAWQQVATLEDPSAVGRIEGLLADLFEHIEHEDREILHPTVLNDDVFAIDSFGG